MTILVPNVDQTSDSFGGWISITNQLATALSTKVVTADSNTTTGNVTISNAFTANQILANTVYGTGNLAIGSNVYFTPYGSANVLVIVGNSTTGEFKTDLTGNTVNISPATTNFAGNKINVFVTNVSMTANSFKTFANTIELGNSSVTVISITSNASSSNLNVTANTVKVIGIANVVGNTTIQANSTLGNIRVVGNNTTSNVTITGNDVWMSAVANINILSTLSVTNSSSMGNVSVTGFVNATSSVNSAIISVGTDLVANTTGVYHTGTVNAASFKTTGITANVTGIYPTSNSSGTTLGSPAKRFIITANTVDTSGLITGGAGLDVTGTANVSTVLNVGANNSLNATAHVISSNSTVNTVITATSITQSNTTATPFVANTTGLYHTGTVNAAVVSTAGIAINTTGINPTSNTSGQGLGNSTSRFVVSANTVDASGLITGGAGATITGTTNTSVALNVGANATINTSAMVVGNSTVNAYSNSTAVLIQSNSTVNTIVTATSIKQSTTSSTPLEANATGIYHTGTINAASFTTTGVRANTTGVFPTSNSSGSALGNTISRFAAVLSTIDASGLITGGSGATITGTTNTTTLYVGVNVLANSTGIVPASNSSGSSLGNTIARWALTASTIAASGAATVANTLATGNTTVTGFANISSTLQVAGGTTLNGTLTLGSTSTAVALVANGTSGSAGQVLVSNGTATYWTAPASLPNSINTQAQFVFSNTVVIDKSSAQGNEEFYIKTQNSAGIGVYGDSLATANSLTSAAYIRLGLNGSSNQALLSIIRDAGNNGIGGVYTDTIATSVLLGTTGARNLQFGTQNAVVQTITSGGNTGFGNTAPAHKLRVEGTTSLAGAVSDITTLAAGNTTLTGFVNVTSTAQVGTTATIGTSVSVASGAFVANSIGMFHTGSSNAASATLGAMAANSLGIYIGGLVNAASYAVGSNFIANSTAIIGTGYANITTSVNSALLTVGTSFIANTTGAYHTGVVNAASHTVGSSLVANATGVYHTGVVNAASHTTSGFVANTTGIFPTSNTVGSSFGNTLSRWVITANSVTASGNVMASGFQYSNGASVGIVVYYANGAVAFPA